MAEEDKKHVAVMPEESISALRIDPDGVYVDCTIGGGAHLQLIAKELAKGKGRLIGFDRYGRAIEEIGPKMEWFGRFEPIHANFADFARVWDSMGLPGVDGALYDLGLSSIQLADASMGLSFQLDGPLDMRYDKSEDTETAAEFIETAEEKEIENLFFKFGERWARMIARRIVEEREREPIRTTKRLAEIIRRAVRGPARRIHPATKCFLALRSHVNRELESIEKSVPAAIERLNPGGRLVVITYHSLEARVIKNIFTKAALGCTCELPRDECTCMGQPTVKWIHRKSLGPTEREIETNKRARSARIRAVERV